MKIFINGTNQKGLSNVNNFKPCKFCTRSLCSSGFRSLFLW
jgi:hypothetical protein